MATIVWPGAVSAGDDLDVGWRNDTSHGDGTEDGSDTAEGFHALQHNKAALLLNAMRGEMGANPSGSFADLAARLNGRLTCRKTANQTFNSTSVVNVTEMVLPVDQTGLDYRFCFEWFWTAGAAGVVLVPSVAVPTVAGTLDVFWETIGLTASATATGTDNTNTVLTTGAAPQSMGFPASTTVPAAAARCFSRCVGVLSNPSATGVIQLRCNLETGTSGITFSRGAWGEVAIS